MKHRTEQTFERGFQEWEIFLRTKVFEQEVLKNCDMSCSTGEGEPWYNQVLLHDYDQSQILDAVKRTYLNFCSCCGERRRRKVSNYLAGRFSFSCWRWISRLWRKQLRGLLGGFSAPPFFTLWTHVRQSIKQKQRLVNFENTGRLSFNSTMNFAIFCECWIYLVIATTFLSYF